MKTARNTMGGERPRNANDAYYTPDALALAICHRLRETIGEHVDRIAEPSCGRGAFVRAAYATWPHASIVYGDPDMDAVQSIKWGDTWPEYSSHAGACWESEFWANELRLDPRWPQGARLILGNPPFGVAESHVRIALQRLGHFEATEPMPRYLAFLLRASFDGSKKRVALRKEAPPLCKWSITPRPSFTGDGCTDGAEYKVFLWQAGFRGATEDRGDIVWTPEKRKLTPEEREVRRARKRAQQEHRARKALPLATTDDLLAELRRRMESAGGVR